MLFLSVQGLLLLNFFLVLREFRKFVIINSSKPLVDRRLVTFNCFDYPLIHELVPRVVNGSHSVMQAFIFVLHLPPRDVGHLCELALPSDSRLGVHI